MSNVDKLFKDKLENHSIPPAPQSWEKVESGISKKNNITVVLRIAAGIALAGLLVTFIINRTNQQQVPEIANKDNNKETAAPITKKEELKLSPEAVIDNSATGSVPKRATSTLRMKTENKIVRPEATVDPDPVVMVPEERLVADVQPQAVTGKRMVLVYSLPTVVKKPDPAPTKEEEKRTGLQKVMDVAMEVKSGDNPLGQLREAKDELFALDFRKDKNKDKKH